MLYLLLSIILGASLSVVMRLAQGRTRGRTGMLAVNYLICTVLSAAAAGLGGLIPQGSGEHFLNSTLFLVVLGLVNGVFYFLSLVLNQVGIRVNGVVLTSIFSKLGGLLIPFLLSMLLFAESPRAVQAVGAVLAVAAIILLNYRKDGEAHIGSVVILFGLLLTEGIASMGGKLFREFGDMSYNDGFLFLTFGTALIICTAYLLRRKEDFGLSDLLFGIGIGVPNFFASRFMLLALQEMPAVIVYPTRSVANILLITLVGILCFGERLRKTQWAAVVLILVSLALLNL